MDLNQLEVALNNLTNLIKDKGLGGTRKAISVQYVGGEVTTLSTQYIKDYASLVEKKLSPLFDFFQHGVQSNLICSKRKLEELIDVFGKNIGSSVDNHTQQRSIKGNVSTYQKIFTQNIKHAKKLIGRTVPSVIVVDKKMSEFIRTEIEMANKSNMNITLRPAFQGGSSIERFEVGEISTIYQELFNNWFLNSKIIIEPFYTLSLKRIKSLMNLSLDLEQSCPFQRNCATSSINLEANGDIFLCVEMADGNRFKLGNLITNKINTKNYQLLLDRETKIHSDCLACDFFKECQGGCMNESFEQKGSLYEKSLYCEIWYSLFKLIDEKANLHGANQSFEWLVGLDRS